MYVGYVHNYNIIMKMITNGNPIKRMCKDIVYFSCFFEQILSYFYFKKNLSMTIILYVKKIISAFHINNGKWMY